MNQLILDLLVGLIISILSFDFMYKGWIMFRHKRKILLWPLRIVYSLVTLVFGSDVAERRKENYFKRAWYYKISVLLGGALGFIGGIIILLSVVLRII